MNLLKTLLLVSVLFMPFSLYAEEDESHFNLGIGTYALNFATSDAYSSDEDMFTGGAVALTIAFTDYVGIRGTLYSLTHEDFDNFEITGTDVSLYLGTGLATQGFKIYIGGGVFSETWKNGFYEEDFSGAQFNGGFGYNWSVVALELVLGVRNVSEYYDDVDSAVSGSLLLSARF